MMQRQHQEPFFKPLNNDHHSFDFAINRNKVRPEHSQHESVSQDQDFAISGERLTSLHAKLHQEADRIRKWKNQTEYDIKQKDQKLKEATHTVEHLRKSILDLQLKNESLSLNLQEEISKREDILQSVNATRELCSVLKDHLTSTEEKVKSCEGEKTEIRYQEEAHKKQYQALSDKFRELEIESKTQQQKLKKDLETIKKEKESLQSEMKIKSENAEEKLKCQMEKIEEKDLEIRDIRAEIQKNEDKIHSLEQTVDKLTKELKTSEDNFDASKSAFDGITVQFELLKTDRNQLEDKLCEQGLKVTELERCNSELHSQMDEAQYVQSQAIQKLEEEMTDFQFRLDKKHQKVLFLETDLEKTVSLLEAAKSSKDMLILDKTELENKVRELEQQNADLLRQHEERMETINQMSATIADLQSQLGTSQQESSVLMHQLNELQQHLANMEAEKHQLEEKINLFEVDVASKRTGLNSLRQELENKQQEIVKLAQEVTKLNALLLAEQQNLLETRTALQETQGEVAVLKKQIVENEKELKKTHKKLEALTTKNLKLEESCRQQTSVEADLRKEIAEMQTVLEEQKGEIETLICDKQQNNEEMNDQLQSKQKAASELESRNKSLKTDLTTKNKHIKELEKEIKGLKTKLTTGSKSLESQEKELGQLRNQLEQELTLRTELGEKIDSLTATKNTLEQSLKETELQMCEMKKATDKSHAEREAMSRQCEAQRAEMGHIMQNYKTENDKLVSMKEKEIETLKSQLKSFKDKKKQSEDEQVSRLQGEVQQLRQMISESGYQMENLQKNFGQKETEVKELVKENMKKEEELKELQQQLESMFIKHTTTSVVQTSPFPNKTYQKQTSPRPDMKNGPPRTPMIQPSSLQDMPKTPSCVRTPLIPQSTPNTSCSMKTPQRSIMKSLAANSASKKRRVMFANRDDDSNSGDSMAFEVMDEDDIKKATSVTPLLLKPSPKSLTPKLQSDVNKQSTLPMKPTPRGLSVDLLNKKKQAAVKDKENTDSVFNADTESLISQSKNKGKPEKQSSVRKAPAKVAGKFFKSSPKHKTQKPKADMNWFENDDIFGFGVED